MRVRSLEHLFERYRRKGDLAALGQVFDRVAPDLLRLACHLVRGHDAAEDVLQATFVVAIERAQRFDPERELRPWLTGILARQAAAYRRREGRSLDEARLQPRAAANPAQAAEAKELSLQLGAALNRLGEPYRKTLEPYLRDGLSPSEIARGLGLAPGTVRMRIHRGLDRLRELLPAGVAAGLAGSLLAPRGLGVVRASVLAKASAVVPAASAVALVGSGGAGVTATVLGPTPLTSVFLSVIMSKATTLGGLGLLTGLAGLWLIRDSGQELSSVDGPAVAVRESSSPSHPGAGPALLFRGSTAARVSTDAPDSGDRGTRTVIEPEEEPNAKLRVRVWVDGVADRHLQGVKVGWTSAAAQLSQPPGRLMLESARLSDRYHEAALEFRTAEEGATLDAQRELEVGPDGSVWLEIPVPNGRRNRPRDAWVLTASHEVYFDGRTTLQLEGNHSLALARGEDVELETRIELRPAAVLRGEVRSEAGNEVNFLSQAVYSMGQIEPMWNAGRVAELSLREADMRTDLQAVGRLLDIEGRTLNADTTVRFMLQPSNSVQVALFPLEHGEPAAHQATERDLGWGGEFELKLDSGGSFVLAVVQDNRRPGTRTVDLLLAEVVELEPIELEAGASLSGFAPALEAGGATMCRAIASLPEHDEVPRVPWAGGLAWLGNAFEWSQCEAEFDENSRFEIQGLAPTTYSVDWSCQADLDLRKPGIVNQSTSIQCSAPAHDLVLGPPVSFVELVFTRNGIPIEELPESEVPDTSEDESEQPVEERGPWLSLVSEQGADELVERELCIEGLHRLRLLSEPEREHSLSLSDENGPLLELNLRAPVLGRRDVVHVETARR